MSRFTLLVSALALALVPCASAQTGNGSADAAQQEGIPADVRVEPDVGGSEAAAGALPAVDAQQRAERSEARLVEVPGVREFSGQLIARPVQQRAWLGHGLSEQQAAARVAAARQAMGAQAVRAYVWQTDEYIFELPPSKTENEVAGELEASGNFQYVEPNWVVYPVDCPNDPLFANQWHHNADRMQSCDGWDIHTGDPSVSVGICDTGILTTHEDLLLHRLEGYNAVDRLWESQGGNIGPVRSHGTLTTGCAAANGDNGVGIAGVGWNLSHRMLRVSNRSDGRAYLADLQHGARTAIENGDRVASVSYSSVDNSSNLTTATYIKSIGGLLVWAAGNDNRNLTFGDREADDIIVVGGTDRNDNKASFSAYGPFVDLAAPAVGVYTTYSASNSAYAGVSGTSFATPLTAGLIALIWSADPTLMPDEVEIILKHGCDDLGSPGLDNTYGYGRINVFNSLSNEPPGPPIAADGFESGNLSGGTGNWVGAWSQSGDAQVVRSGAPNTGARHVRLQRANGYLERAVDLTDASNVHLTFWAKVRSFEGNDQAVVKVSSDGVDYPIVKTFTSADSDDIYHYCYIDLSSMTMTADFRVVFDAEMNATNDRWFVDDIEIIGSAGPPSPGITVVPTAGLITHENPNLPAATFSVVLNTQPTADVTIDLSSSDLSEGTVSPASLIFIAADWDLPQQVIVTGVDDAIVDGNIPYTIVTAPAVSADPDYNGLDAADVSVTNLDDDGAGVTVFSISPDSMSAGSTIDVTITGAGFQAGATVTFENGKGPAPTADVTYVSVDGFTIEATITAPGGGPRGERVWDVRVTNPDGSTGTLTDGFTVIR